MKKIVIATMLLITSNVFIYSQNQDCINPHVICEMGTYRIESVSGIGQEEDKVGELTCSGTTAFKETNSYWIEWSPEQDGTMTFVIDPINEGDDYDFALFENQGNCNALKEIRCMASGESLGSGENRSCLGATGLSIESVDQFEKSGCTYDDDNYLKMLSAESGKTYVLWVNNFASGRGFSITFEGAAELKEHALCKSETLIKELFISRIFPNPSKDIINIEYNSKASSSIQIQILDMSGKLTSSQEFTPEVSKGIQIMDVSSLSSGSYLLRLIQGENIIIKQFVKA